MPRALALPLAAVLLVLADWAAAADARPRVIGYERFHAGAKGDAAAAGQLLLGELNCTRCHQADGSWSSHVLPKQAPVLDKIGARARPQWMREFLANPPATKPGTTMPHVLAALPDQQRQAAVEALVHFLASTGPLAEAPGLRQSVNRGEPLYHTVGCAVCHGGRREGSPALATSIPLGTPSKKHTIPGLTQFLQDPLAVRPSGRMPHLNLDPAQARDIASYLLSDLTVAAGLQYAYYEGSFNKLPDFQKLKPKETGDAEAFSVAVAKRKDNFALRFDGEINVPKEGEYLFVITSDDGSRLYVDDKVVIENDGIHPPQQKRKAVKLKAGLHSVAVEYFEQGGGEELKVEFALAGGNQQPLETLLAIPMQERSPTASAAFLVDAKLAEQGRQLFGSLGCASCHELKQKGQAIASQVTAAPIAALKGEGGCLSATPVAKAPYFPVDDGQRQAIRAALAAMKKPAAGPASPQEAVDRTLVAFNCYGCHARGQIGGPEEARNEFFKTDMPEMGDEGRLPPHLTGAGVKLRPEWLKELFDAGAKDRPYMLTKMPKFGGKNLAHLAAALAEADKDLFRPEPKLDVSVDDKKLKAVGRRLVGAQGFGCIKCHMFADKKATGIQALSLTTLTKRLQPDWFHFYMQNPQVWRPGTRMPTAFPNGESTLPSLLDGSVDKQVRSIWAYLLDGDQAIQPVGLVTGKMELVAYDEAVMYRNFIEGAGSRAIGVGYAEKLNLAFDANQLRLAMLWHGAFIDAAKHWTGRGQGYEKPLGDNVLKLPEGPLLAALDSADAAWPAKPAKELGFQFRGYKLDAKRRPTFLYSFQKVAVEDAPQPVGDAEVFTMRRTLRFSSPQPPEHLYLRAMVADKIEALADGWHLIDGKWKLKVAAPGQPVLRQSQGKTELLVPLPLTGGQTEVALEYDW